MKINITARHFTTSAALTEMVEKTAEAFSQHHDNIISVDAVLEKTDLRNSAEFVVHVAGKTVVAKGEESDLYKALHIAGDNIVRQLQKIKEKGADHV